MERPIVYKKHCPLFMTTVTHFNPKEYRIPVDTEKLLSGCAGKRMEVSKRPVFMDIQNFKNATAKVVGKPLDAAPKKAKSVVNTKCAPALKPLDVKVTKALDVVVRSARGTPVSTPVAPRTPALKPSTPSVVATPSANTPPPPPPSGGKPGPPGKTGLSTYQEEICHIKKSTSCFKCR